jgi:phage terminase large subunit GpA-like protein
VTTATADGSALRAALSRCRQARLKPPPKLTMSEWADQHRFLSREASAEPGRWRTSRTPYAREPMDAISDTRYEEVVLMWAAQSAKTEVVLNTIGFYADQDPAPILVVQPNVEPMAQAFSKDRVATMVRDTPRLKDKIADAKSRTSDNTILHKTFPGGHLTITGANSAAGLASRPIRVVCLDEVDRYPPSAGSEGDPVMLATKRTTTFWNRKILKTSTPTLKHVSRIEADYQAGSQGTYLVPCPHCEKAHALVWENMKWTNHDPATAHMVCPACGGVIEERHKGGMLTAGAWVHEYPERRRRSFHLNALYSPWARWSALVAEFLEAQGKPELLKAFVNTVLAQTWEDEKDRSDPESLMNRRSDYLSEANPHVPAFVGLLTAGCDVQADRVEILVRGWGEGEQSALVHLETIRGDPARAETWGDVGRVLDRTWDGLKVSCACVDSGYLPDEVYKFCRGRRRTFPTKGNSTPGQPIIGSMAKRPNQVGVRVVPVGTETAKTLLYQRLKNQHPGPGFYHFPLWAGTDYFEQLTAEYTIRKYKHGRPYTVYEKDPNRRNEALDMEVLSYVALLLLGPTAIRSLGTHAEKRVPQAVAPAAPEPTPAQQLIKRILHPQKKPGFARDW